MGFLLTLGVWAATWALDYYLRKSAADDSPRQEEEGIPRVSESDPIPFVFGRWLIESSNVVWAGNLGSDSDIVGDLELGNLIYRGDILFALCLTNVPVSDPNSPGYGFLAAYGFRAGGVRPNQGGWLVLPPVNVPGVSRYSVHIPMPQGQDVAGTLEYSSGHWSTDHGPLTTAQYTQAGLDPLRIEPHRGVMTVMAHLSWGRIPYSEDAPASSAPPPIAFEVVNPCIMPDYPFGKQEWEDGSNNPISVLYTVLTAGWGRLKIDPSTLDMVTFEAVAEVCWQERNGMSGMVTNKESAISIVQRILDQIEATLYVDPDSLLLTVKAIREDYDPNTLPHVTQDMVTREPEWTSTTYADTLNLVRVTFTNSSKEYKQDEVLAHDQANFDVTGVVRDQTFDFPWVTYPGLASRIATRILRANALPLDKVQFGASRALVFYTPGLVFKYTHTNGVTSIMRVLRVEAGSTANGEVTVHAAIDRWSVSYTLVEPPVTEVEAAPVQPQAPLDEDIVEAPRWLLERKAILEGGPDPDGARLMYLAAPSDLSTRYRGFIDTTGVADEVVRDTQIVNFTGSGRLRAEYPRTADPFDTTIGIGVTDIQHWTPATTTALNLQTRGLNLVQLGEGATAEIVGFLTVSTDGADRILEDVYRGLLDTTPRTHPIGTPVFELNLRVVPSQDRVVARLGAAGFNATDSLLAKIAPMLGTASPNLEDVEAHAITARERPLLPYPVADLETAVLVWSCAYAASSKGAETAEEDGVNLTWVRRDRLSPTITLGTEADEPSPESDVTYSFIVQKTGDTAYTIYSGQDGVAIYSVPTGKAGHGELTVSVRTARTAVVGGSTVTYESWQDASVADTYKPWRNLIVNPHFTVNSGLTMLRWTTDQGTPSIVATGPYLTHHYVKGTLNDDPTQWHQIIRADGYRPKRMRATLTFKAKNVTGGDTDDTFTTSLISLDSDEAALNTVTQGPTAPGANWTKYEIALNPLANAAVGFEVNVTQTAVGEPGFETPTAAIADPELRLGQFTDQLLLNPSLNTTANWTVSAGSFSNGSSNAAEGGSYITGDNNATNTIYQEAAVAAGYHYGEAVFQIGARLASSFTGSVSVTIEARDSGGAVLASQTKTPAYLVAIGTLGWTRTRVHCAVPLTTSVIRVTMSSTKTGLSNAVEWDDGDLRIHKYLDAQQELAFDFSNPALQVIPKSPYVWSANFAADVPDYGMFPGVAFGVLGIEPQMTVEDDVRLGRVFTPNQYDAYEFREGTPAVVRSRSNYSYANFTSDDSFTVLVMFCPQTALANYGLCGRLGTTGWELDVFGSSVRARLVGASSTKTATSGAVLRGGLTIAGLIYNATTDELTVITPTTTSTVSTAGMGAIVCDEDVLFAIGDAVTTAPTVMTGTIAGVYLWASAQPSADLQALLTWGSDTWSNGASIADFPIIASPVACIVGSNDDGAVVGEFASGTPGTWAKVGDSYGVPMSPTRTNATAPNPNTDTDWDGDATVELSAAIAPNGRWEAVAITGTIAESRQLTVSLTDTDPFNISCMLKCSAATTIAVQVMEADGTTPCHSAIEFDVTESWQRFDAFNVTLDPGSAPAKVAWYAPGGVEVLYLAGPIWIDQDPFNPAPPVAIPTSGTDPTSYITAEALSLDPHYNYEGEIVANLVTYSQDAEQGTLVRMVSNGSDHHKLYVGGGQARFSHRDSAGTEVVSEITETTDWRTPQTVRGRWNRLGLLDAASAFAGVVSDSGQDFDRAATWTPSTLGYDTLEIGHTGAIGGFNGLLIQVTVRAREAILPDTL